MRTHHCLVARVKLAFYQKPYVLKDGVTYGTRLVLQGVQVISAGSSAGVDAGTASQEDVASLFGKTEGFKLVSQTSSPTSLRVCCLGMTTSKFRSGLEERIADLFSNLGVIYEYEPIRIAYTLQCQYCPDFVLPNGVHIEAKAFGNQLIVARYFR